MKSFKRIMRLDTLDAPKQSDHLKKTQSPKKDADAIYGILGLIVIVAGMWLWGVATGWSDSREGISLFQYEMKKSDMNFISFSGYSCYIGHFTDIKQRRDKLAEDCKKNDAQLKKLEKMQEQYQKILEQD